MCPPLEKITSYPPVDHNNPHFTVGADAAPVVGKRARAAIPGF